MSQLHRATMCHYLCCELNSRESFAQSRNFEFYRLRPTRTNRLQLLIRKPFEQKKASATALVLFALNGSRISRELIRANDSPKKSIRANWPSMVVQIGVWFPSWILRHNFRMQLVCLQLEASCLQFRLFAYNCVWELFFAYNWSFSTHSGSFLLKKLRCKQNSSNCKRKELQATRGRDAGCIMGNGP